MAGTPQWKVYDAQKKYQAACKEVEAAAALASFYGDGATIRLEHSLVVWTEGKDGEAGESYDAVATLAERRRQQHARESYAQAYGTEALQAALKRQREIAGLA